MKSTPRKSSCNPFEEEAQVTEIEISPDGRLFLFGASTEVLKLLQACGFGNPSLDQRISNAPPVVLIAHSTEKNGCHE